VKGLAWWTALHAPRQALDHPIVAETAEGYPERMDSKLRSLAILVLGAALIAFVATGCNTTKGLGKDVEKLGDKIQDKASR
jgi:entericidin A